ncbi:LLM class F420-dependent oxidoreductase [Gordonia sp. CPCC 206044]|uniref:LLM class F420-dependent oxidoreductase n=1 Tax=Gordonia sp. CPCC 206044 TaxID=3140793 RepID=UPI003AF406CD
MNETDPTALLVDSGVASRLTDAPSAAAQVEASGFDGCWAGETNHDPFLALTLAAEHTSRVEIGTNIAVAFARNPMSVAQLAWDLQDFSQGRFNLGLGTQIKPHIEKRFAMPWSDPVPRMREFLEALQAIWSSWRDGTRLRFEGRYYTHKIMSPLFTPDPSPQSFPKIFVAAVGGSMTEMCGEVADGMLTHPFTTKAFQEQVTLPTLQRGLDRAGRRRADFQLTSPLFVVTGEDERSWGEAAEMCRRQVAFYGSTPAYRKVLELHGWGDLQTELRELSLRGEWDRMGDCITDEILSTFAVVAPVDDLAERLRARCVGVVDRVIPAFPKSLSAEAITSIVTDLKNTTVTTR